MHRVKHKPEGDPCAKCGLGPTGHRPRVRSTGERRGPKDKIVCMLDGEGRGRTKHRYVLLAVGDRSGKHAHYIQNANGLSTEACLEFLMGLPRDLALFGFALGYDWTKILADLTDGQLYRLFRPETRQPLTDSRSSMPVPVAWRGYRLNFVATRMSIARGKRRIVVWDVFKFFQAKFTTALVQWSVATEKQLRPMIRMKAQRAHFDDLPLAKIREYCLDECRKGAALVESLQNAHEKAGLPLRSYYGAGSTASALLASMRIKGQIRKPPEAMRHAIASAFFGGRFEHAVAGPIRGRVWSYDLSSAYPYELCFLPCLVHGQWSHTVRRADLDRLGTTAACIRYELDAPKDSPLARTWGPLPFRTSDGSIVFPAQSGGGWVWDAEYRQAERFWPNVRFCEAWILRSDCSCQPFHAIPNCYRERVRIGKEGAGIVFKLGPNSCYGKLAQSVGRKPPYQSWVWAGMITSGTRARFLEALGLHTEPRRCLGGATDGFFTLERMAKKLPAPEDTGTAQLLDQQGKTVRKPLGGWEEKDGDAKGCFFARPGIYFPLAPTIEELSAVRARGIGRASMIRGWKTLVDGWKAGRDSVQLAPLIRFVGAKTGVHMTERGPVRSRDYGQWVERPVTVSFDPLPKRAGMVDVQGQDYRRLTLRSMPSDLRSTPYERSLLSPAAVELKAAEIEAWEQPDCDYTDE